MASLAAIDVAIIAAFVVWALASGLRSRKAASRGLEEYFLAGRTLPGWQAGLSMSATQFAADTPLLVTGLVATSGIFSLWQLWMYGLAFLLMGFVFAPLWRRAAVVTDAELSELRYSGKAALWLRAVKALYFGTLFNCTVLAWVLFAASRIAEPFLRWHEWLPASLHGAVVSLVESVGVPLVAAHVAGEEVWLRTADNLLSIGAIVLVTLFYSATGGLRSVVRTDVMQLAFMLVGTLFYAVVVVREAGGLGAMLDSLEGASTALSANELLAFTPSQAAQGSGALFAVLGLQWLLQLNSDGTGYLAQRSMACRDDREATNASLVFTFTQIVLRSLMWLPLALGLLVLFPPDPELTGAALQADREGTFVRGMAELLPVGLRGLMLTAMLAALASTVDTHLNWGASYWTNDVYRRIVCETWLGSPPREWVLVWVARASNVLVLLLALVVMTQLDSIAQAWRTSLLLGAGLGVPLVLRWVWWRMTARAELAALLTSLLAAPLLVAWMDDEWLRMLAVALLSTTAAIATALLAGPEPVATLRRFHERVQPPGFWGPVARSEREERRALGRRLLAAGLAAFGVFCLLVGAGTLLVRGTPPSWWPAGGTSWALLLLVLFVVSVPLWRRLDQNAHRRR